MQTNNEPVKIFRMNECDWYVARSLEEAVACVKRDYGDIDEDMWEECRELTDEEMNNSKYWDSENTDKCAPEHWRCSCGYRAYDASWQNRWTGKVWEHLHGADGYEPMKCTSEISFVEALCQHLAAESPVPCLFASTEI